VTVIGHDSARAELERHLPPVALLLGPCSIGKTTLATHLIAHHRCHWSMYYGSTLSAGLAREIVQSAPTRRSMLDIRIIDLDGSTEAAQNILLKVLEEPPPHCRFILVASREPLATITSRAQVYRLGLLTDEQVAQVLHKNAGIGEHAAAMAAARGRGQVAPAVAAAEDSEADRVTSAVALAVRAATQGSLGSSALSQALRSWTEEHTVVLRRWATEAASGRWVIFTQDFAPGVAPASALRVLESLSKVGAARTGPAVALSALLPPPLY